MPLLGIDIPESASAYPMWPVTTYYYNQFISYTFVCDTAARVHFYFSKKTVAFLKSAGRIETDEESGAYFLTVAGRKATVRVTPQTHQPVNFMGMLMLERLGLEMSEGSFTFAHPLPYL